MQITEGIKMMALSGLCGGLDERNQGEREREVSQGLPKLGCLSALVQTAIKQKL